MPTSTQANRTFLTHGYSAPRARHIHLMTAVEREQTNLQWPTPGSIVADLGLWRIWTPFDEPLPTPSAHHNVDKARPATACAWQHVQLTRELDADLCLHGERNFISEYIRTNRYSTTGKNMNWRDCAPFVRLYQHSLKRQQEGLANSSSGSTKLVVERA